jgi:hypothetical protein
MGHVAHVCVTFAGENGGQNDMRAKNSSVAKAYAARPSAQK